MKKSILLFVFLVTFYSLRAQLSLNSSGYVTITKDLTAGGGLTFTGGTYSIRSTSLQYPSIKINRSNGYVGINKGGSDAQYSLDVGATMRVVSTLYTSDSKVKKDIKDLPKTKLDGLASINAKYYKFDSTLMRQYGMAGDVSLKKDHFGFLAQDVQKIYPELVYEDSLGLLSIDYIGMIPILWESVKSLKSEVEALKAKSSQKQKSVEGVADATANTPYLAQNRPNPFNENTTIEFYLPATAKSATVYVYDLQGKQIKCYVIAEREQGSLTIHASELQPGMYYYSLIADGVVMGTEKMILTD